MAKIIKRAESMFSKFERTNFIMITIRKIIQVVFVKIYIA